MVPSQTQERVGTPFDNGDQLDLHMPTEASRLTYDQLLKARQDTELAYEATGDTWKTTIGKGAVASSIDSAKAPPVEINQPLSPVEEATLMTGNLNAIRRYYLENPNSLPTRGGVSLKPRS